MKKNVLFIFIILFFPIVIFSEEVTVSEPAEQVQIEMSEIARDAIENLPDPDNNTQINNNESASSEIALNMPSVNEFQNNLLIDENSTASSTFPIKTTLGYNFNSSDSNGNYFLNAEGSDILNKERDRKINFLIKVPYFQQTPESNKFQPAVEKFTLNFIDPSLDITLGDSKYDLSPLTIKDNEKRGALFRLKQDIANFDIIYLMAKPEKKNVEKADNLASSICIKPNDFINISTNYVYSKFTNASSISNKKNNHTYSLRAILKPSSAFNLELESAICNSLNVKSALINTLGLKKADSIEKRNYAHFANLDGKISGFSYKFTLIHLNPLFVSNIYEKDKQILDKSKIDGFIKFERKGFGLKLSDVFERKNLENSSMKKDKPKRDNNLQLTFNYPLLNLKNTFGVNRREMKVLTKHDGYKLDAINLSSIYPLKKISFENALEYGLYKSRAENYKTRNWRSYKLLLDYKPTSASSFSIYTKLGNLLYEEIFIDSIALGTTFKIKMNKNFDLSFTYEFSDNTRKANPFPKSKAVNWKGNYFKQDFSYTLSNNHKIVITSHLNKPLSEKKEKELLITYSIPFDVPNINRAIDRIRSAF